MKKFTLLLGLALLWGGTNVVALGATPEDGDVTATEKTPLQMFEDGVADAVTKANAYPKALKNYNEALSNFKVWLGKDSVEYKTEVIEENTNYTTLLNDMTKLNQSSQISVFVGSQGLRTNMQIVYIEKTLYDELEKSNSSALEGITPLKKTVTTAEKETIQKAVFLSVAEYMDDEMTYVPPVTSAKIAKFYYINEAGELAFKTVDIPAAQIGAHVGDIYMVTWPLVKGDIPEKKVTGQTEVKEYFEAKQKYIEARDILAKTPIEPETVTITLSCNIKGFSKTIAEVPSNCIINGAGYSIESSAALFEVNKGTIRNLANPVGLIAIENEGRFGYCLEKTDATTYRTYISNTNYKDQQNVSLAEVIYGLNGFLFGLQVDDLAFVPGMKIYKAYYASAANKNLQTIYVNVNNGAVNTPNSMSAARVPKNAVLYIDDAKLAPFGTNIAVKVDDEYTCATVELTEGTEFYIPMDVTALALNYDREFKDTEFKYSSVCLPFALPIDKVPGLKVYQFSDISADNTTMSFSYVPNPVANTPYLINYTEAGKLFENLTGIKLEATPTQMQTKKAKGDFCGVYKMSYVSDLIQNSGYAVYGISDGKLVQAKSYPSDWLSPFRSYVYCNALTAADNAGAGAPSYKIALLEEEDTETGIETVATAETIGVKGGESIVEVTTDKACKVNVYSMNGMLVKSENVEAGITTLPVKAGMYVVNGVKVIVK